MMGKDMLWYIEGLMQIKVVYSTSSLYLLYRGKIDADNNRFDGDVVLEDINEKR